MEFKKFSKIKNKKIKNGIAKEIIETNERETINNSEEKKAKESPFLFINHDYVIAQLIPTKSSKSSNPERIFNEINKMHHKIITLEECLKNKKITFNQPFKASYYIQVKQKKVNFYFIFPTEFKSKFEIILSSIWRGIQINYIDELPVNLDEFEKRQMQYVNKDSLSINSDKKDKFLLKSITAISDSIEEEEEIGLFYNFIPTAQKESDFFKTNNYKKDIEDYKKGIDPSKAIDPKKIIAKGLKEAIMFTEETVSMVFNDSKKSDSFLSTPKKPSPYTNKKAQSSICKTQMVALVKANDKEDTKRLYNEINKAFDIITGDNQIKVTKKLKDQNISLFNPLVSNVNTNNTCVLENLSLMKMPNRDMLDIYNEAIEHNKSIEMKIPECLKNGKRLIGLAKCLSKEIPVYFSTDSQIQRAEVVLVGPKGAGKTLTATNMALNSAKEGRGVAIIEVIEDCPMCKRFLKEADEGKIDKNRILNIDCRNFDNIPAVCYNEIEMWPEMESELKVKRAIQRAQQLQYFLESIQTDDNKNLTPRMMKYFYAACAITYCVDVYASFNEIMNVLQHVTTRKEYVDALDCKCAKLLSNRIKQLDEIVKNDGTTDFSKISGILDREAQFSAVSYESEQISQKKSHDNIDFVKAMQENKIILMQLPEHIFTNPTIKSTMATFFLSKIWNAKKQLSPVPEDERMPTELYFDEFYKCDNATKIYEDIFVEGRKYNLISIVTVHTLDQLSSLCKMRLTRGGASYILMYGCNSHDFKFLSSDFDEDIEYGHLKDLEKHHGLCLIKNEEKNYSSFIVKFPKFFDNYIGNNKEDDKEDNKE